MKFYSSLRWIIALSLVVGNVSAQTAPKPVTEDRYQANIDSLERTQALLLGKPVPHPNPVVTPSVTAKPLPEVKQAPVITEAVQAKEIPVKPVAEAPKAAPQTVRQINNPVEKTILLQPETEVKSKDAIPAWQVQLN